MNFRAAPERMLHGFAAAALRLLLGTCVVWVAALPSAQCQAPSRPGASATPHEKLASLGNGEALDLGPYECESRVPRLRCETIFDYSRINYDPYRHRMLVFGGGHAATGRTDVDVFDLATLKWRGLYPSMGCEQIEANDIDPRGFHRATGHAVARHTYDQNVIAEVNGRGRLLMFSTEGFKGTCHSYNVVIRGVAELPLDAEHHGWAFGQDTAAMPWGYAGAAEFDPVSAMVLLTGGQSSGMWVYDPATRRVIAALPHFARAKTSSNLLYDPRGDRMLLVDSVSSQIRSYTLDRKNWLATVETVLKAAGSAPGGLRNLAYDSHNHVIGGIQDGVFHAFDLATHRWSSYPVVERPQASGSVGTVRHHAIDYDPVNNVFVFVSGRPGTLRTWAFRFKN